MIMLSLTLGESSRFYSILIFNSTIQFFNSTKLRLIILMDVVPVQKKILTDEINDGMVPVNAISKRG